jgi:hypothetical protein
MIRIALAAAAAVSCFAFQTKKEADGPSDKVPELKILDHYVGEWEVEFTSNAANFAKSKSTAKWVLGGRFVEQTGDVLNADGSVAIGMKTLFTFDSKKNAYRSWIFTSDGSVTESDCVWDDKAKTLTSITKKVEGEGFTTTTADFSEPGVEKWKIVIRDAADKVTAEITGKNTKLKKK